MSATVNEHLETKDMKVIKMLFVSMVETDGQTLS